MLFFLMLKCENLGLRVDTVPRFGLLDRRWILRSSANRMVLIGGGMIFVMSCIANKDSGPLSGEP